jgi:predicted HicB family RNase H-like nuclease
MTQTHRKNGEFRKGHAIRQKGEKRASDHLHIRVLSDAKSRWAEKARAAGLPLSEWVTRTLNAAS